MARTASLCSARWKRLPQLLLLLLLLFTLSAETHTSDSDDLTGESTAAVSREQLNSFQASQSNDTVTTAVDPSTADYTATSRPSAGDVVQTDSSSSKRKIAAPNDEAKVLVSTLSETTSAGGSQSYKHTVVPNDKRATISEAAHTSNGTKLFLDASNLVERPQNSHVNAITDESSTGKVSTEELTSLTIPLNDATTMAVNHITADLKSSSGESATDFKQSQEGSSTATISASVYLNTVPITETSYPADTTSKSVAMESQKAINSETIVPFSKTTTIRGSESSEYTVIQNDTVATTLETTMQSTTPRPSIDTSISLEQPSTFHSNSMTEALSTAHSKVPTEKLSSTVSMEGLNSLTIHPDDVTAMVLILSTVDSTASSGQSATDTVQIEGSSRKTTISSTRDNVTLYVSSPSETPDITSESIATQGQKEISSQTNVPFNESSTFRGSEYSESVVTVRDTANTMHETAPESTLSRSSIDTSASHEKLSTSSDTKTEQAISTARQVDLTYFTVSLLDVTTPTALSSTPDSITSIGQSPTHLPLTEDSMVKNKTSASYDATTSYVSVTLDPVVTTLLSSATNTESNISLEATLPFSETTPFGGSQPFEPTATPNVTAAAISKTMHQFTLTTLSIDSSTSIEGISSSYSNSSTDESRIPAFTDKFTSLSIFSDNIKTTEVTLSTGHSTTSSDGSTTDVPQTVDSSSETMASAFGGATKFPFSETSDRADSNSESLVTESQREISSKTTPSFSDATTVGGSESSESTFTMHQFTLTTPFAEASSSVEGLSTTNSNVTTSESGSTVSMEVSTVPLDDATTIAVDRSTANHRIISEKITTDLPMQETALQEATTSLSGETTTVSEFATSDSSNDGAVTTTTNSHTDVYTTKPSVSHTKTDGSGSSESALTPASTASSASETNQNISIRLPSANETTSGSSLDKSDETLVPSGDQTTASMTTSDFVASTTQSTLTTSVGPKNNQVNASITLNLSYSSINDSNQDTRVAFEDALIKTIKTVLSLSSEAKLTITKIRSGSVIVDFRIDSSDSLTKEIAALNNFNASAFKEALIYEANSSAMLSATSLMTEIRNMSLPSAVVTGTSAPPALNPTLETWAIAAIIVAATIAVTLLAVIIRWRRNKGKANRERQSTANRRPGPYRSSMRGSNFEMTYSAATGFGSGASTRAPSGFPRQSDSMLSRSRGSDHGSGSDRKRNSENRSDRRNPRPLRCGRLQSQENERDQKPRLNRTEQDYRYASRYPIGDANEENAATSVSPIDETQLARRYADHSRNLPNTHYGEDYPWRNALADLARARRSSSISDTRPFSHHNSSGSQQVPDLTEREAQSRWIERGTDAATSSQLSTFSSRRTNELPPASSRVLPRINLAQYRATPSPDY